MRTFLPEVIKIREFAVGGIAYVSALMDINAYPKSELAAPYHRRWNMELEKGDWLGCRLKTVPIVLWYFVHDRFHSFIMNEIQAFIRLILYWKRLTLQNGAFL